MSEMAVDLTTGTYDEDGVFSKHNDESKESEKFNADEIFCSLKNFRSVRVIKECLHEKSLAVEGHFVGDDKPAIVIVEKMPFHSRDITRIFNADCRLELKFRNNIYANYHVYPPNGLNGFDIKVIYPATEDDFAAFIDEPLKIVTETIGLYKSAVLPYFKSISLEKGYLDCFPNALNIYEEQDSENGFILLENNPEKCSCSTKHIRAVCVIKQKDVLSLRDLTSEKISLLKRIKLKCLEELSSKYGLPDSKFLTYVCYPPVHFPFHVYFETVEKDHPIPTEKAHHLETIICNLQLIPDYYKKVTLTYSLTQRDALLEKMQNYSNNEQ